MAGPRDAAAYSKRKPVVNTRKSKLHKYSYVKVVPPMKIVKFNMGDIPSFEAGKFKIVVTIATGEKIQIRDLALEATRQSLNKDLTNTFQKAYFLRCNVFPHNILRNNRVFSGASKGERVQTGMSKSFGTSEGRAATIRKGNPIFTIYFNGDVNIPKVREAVRKVKAKLPCKVLVNVVVNK